MSLRPLSIAGATPPPSTPAQFGPAPGAGWVALDALVVDMTYQRPITTIGWRNVRKIAGAFSWLHFAPLIIAPATGAPGKLAIIDGQHRATAALFVGVGHAPALTLDADQKQQAAAFKAINGIVTKVHALQAHKAALVAGEIEAVAIADVAARAGVEVAPYPIPAEKLKPGQTLALGTLKTCLRQYGAATLITALQCITETENNEPGNIRSTIIAGLCAVLDRRRDWRDSGERLLRALDEVDLGALFDALGTRHRSAHVLAGDLEREIAIRMRAAA